MLARPFRTIPLALSLALVTAFTGGALAQPGAGDKGGDKAVPTAAKPDTAAPVVTHHSITTPGGTLNYTVTTGKLPLKDDQGETQAEIFFVAYTRDGVPGGAARPLMFSFNGGPGSASVWLHLGCVGPKRVKMRPDGQIPSPPYQLIDNAGTWLDQTDLVFIDPVGTGYSRAIKPENGKKYWGVQGDLESVGEFIRLYLTRYQRWSSPLFLVGESYGTTRAAGLSGYLVDRGIAFNGIILVSSILNFETADFERGNELPYELFLPTYTATAWYHKKLPADLQSGPLSKALAEAEDYASGEYARTLALGDQVTPDARKQTIDKLSRLTGIRPEYIDESNLRVDIQHFCKELLRDQRRSVGRLDSRFKGIDENAANATPDTDPLISAIRPPYTATFNQYVRAELGYKTDQTYYILGGGITTPWDWGSAGGGFPDVSQSLKNAFVRNPDMKLFVASGHFDLGTPFFATQYTLAHLGLEPADRARITTKEYEAGHMMYIDEAELAKLKADVSAFIKSALVPR